MVNRSYLVPSNNGASQPFSFVTPPEPPYANIPAGYILQVTNAGALVVQCAGTFGNIIPPGPQILLPTDISYIVKSTKRLCKNTVVSTGFTDTTQFTNPRSANAGLRDSHVNDAFDGVVAFAWSDNSNIAKTNNTLNLMVAIGQIDNEGKVNVGAPVQLTNLAPGVMVWDTAIAINRADKMNIVVSYAVLDYNVHPGNLKPFRAVSFDGGVTWPTAYNGQINILDPLGNPVEVGDNPGVRSDKFGNIWYGATNYYDASGNYIDQPLFAASHDKGKNFQVVFTAPVPTNFPIEVYDYPQYCFGGDGQGNYGLHFVVDVINQNTSDFFPTVGFIPITGLGHYPGPNASCGGSIKCARLTSLTNVNITENNTASLDGRVWMQGTPISFGARSYIQPAGVIFKSPGLIDKNYAGVWDFAIYNDLMLQYNVSILKSQPVFGYINNSVQSIIYDENRQALYSVFAAQIPDNSQNMRLYFMISRDNGQTWSNPLDISTTDFANRGFQSMALDTVTGDLVFGWYDGRNDPTFTSVEYFAAVITAKKLDELVNKIPLSNPLYTLGSAAVTPQMAKGPVNEKRAAAMKRIMERRFKDRYTRKA